MIEKFGAILATASIVSGCGHDWNVFDRDEPTYTPAPTPQIQVYTEQGLPPIIGEQAMNVVDIHDEVWYWNFEGEIQGCSGVRIDTHRYLTAGHCDVSNDIVNQALFDCQDITATSIGMPTVTATRKASRVPITKEGDPSKAMLSEPDMMLLESPEPLVSTTQFSSLPNEIPVGTGLYTINYQPLADGTERHPDPEQLPPEERQGARTVPLILAMVAVNNVDSETIEAITIGKSFDDTGDTRVRGGASGGPVYDTAGGLVGILTSTDDTIRTIGEFEYQMGYDVVGVADETPISLAGIKLVNPQAVDQLASEMTDIKQCNN